MKAREPRITEKFRTPAGKGNFHPNFLDCFVSPFKSFRLCGGSKGLSLRRIVYFPKLDKTLHIKHMLWKPGDANARVPVAYIIVPFVAGQTYLLIERVASLTIERGQPTGRALARAFPYRTAK